MLEFINVTKKYRKADSVFTALDDVSVKIEQGDYIVVVGPSGSGKSTLLHIAGGLIHPDSGEVIFREKNVYSLNARELDLYRKRNVGFVFQQFHLMPYLTVYENIKMVCSEPDSRQHIDGYLEKFYLLPMKNKYPSELSVGEKQRVAFIRAIITKPDILLADEPTGNLDPDNSRVLLSLISEYHHNGGTILLVTHDPGFSESGHKQIRLKSGKKI